MVRNGRRLFPWRWNCCLSVCARELCAVRAVPVIVWRRTRQPRFPPRKGAPRVAFRTARQSRDCLRVRPRSGAFRIAAFRCGGGGPRGWHGRAAVFGAPPLRHRESAFIRDGPSIRRYGALGLVAMPPCANRIRPGGVLPLAASDPLWPRGRHASPLARYRHMSVSAVRVPRTLR